MTHKRYGQLEAISVGENWRIKVNQTKTEGPCSHGFLKSNSPPHRVQRGFDWCSIPRIQSVVGSRCTTLTAYELTVSISQRNRKRRAETERWKFDAGRKMVLCFSLLFSRENSPIYTHRGGASSLMH